MKSMDIINHGTGLCPIMKFFIELSWIENAFERNSVFTHCGIIKHLFGRVHKHFIEILPRLIWNVDYILLSSIVMLWWVAIDPQLSISVAKDYFS